jgi:hypothetical protein
MCRYGRLVMCFLPEGGEVDQVMSRVLVEVPTIREIERSKASSFVVDELGTEMKY